MQEKPARQQTVSWFVLGLMSSVTFVGILSELLPSGVLPQMAAGLGVSENQIGFLVGVYALASAIFAIPLVRATLPVNRKAVLLVLLAGFAVSNIVVGLSSSYTVIVISRIIGGLCAGVMWPMIAAYGTRLVPPEVQGKAVTIIMAGNTLGISVGLPAMTTLGINFGWRIEFITLGLIVALIGVLSFFALPSVEGEPRTKSNSPLAVLSRSEMLVILALTFLSVAAHYGIYTYIALLVAMLDFAGGIGFAMLIFGIGSVLSVVLSARYIDAHLQTLVVSMLILGLIAMGIFLLFGRTPGIAHLGFFLWGIAFGPLVTMYQTAVIKRFGDARDVATSVQSTVFNFSIMVATWIGGLLLTETPGAQARGVVYMSLIAFTLATLIAIRSRRTLRS